MRKTIFRLALISIAVLLAAVAPAAAQTGTVVRVNPAYKLVRQGDEFVLTIQIDDVVSVNVAPGATCWKAGSTRTIVPVWAAAGATATNSMAMVMRAKRKKVFLMGPRICLT